MAALYESRELATAAVEKLKVFAQPQRLMILSCLLRGKRNVGEIAQATGIGQPALSQQLAELRRADLVRADRKAQQVWYALADEGVALCVRNMESIFGSVGVTGELGAAAGQSDKAA
jgi:DNA-binding transcriptional ArsR family regulator